MIHDQCPLPVYFSQVAGSLVVDLNEDGTTAGPLDIDDRRFVFQVASPTSKKAVILQAENERERDEVPIPHCLVPVFQYKNQAKFSF